MTTSTSSPFPVTTSDPYHDEITRAGYVPTPALIAEVQKLHRAALNEALVTRAFAAVRAANKRRGAS